MRPPMPNIVVTTPREQRRRIRWKQSQLKTARRRRQWLQVSRVYGFAEWCEGPRGRHKQSPQMQADRTAPKADHEVPRGIDRAVRRRVDPWDPGKAAAKDIAHGSNISPPVSRPRIGIDQMRSGRIRPWQDRAGRLRAFVRSLFVKPDTCHCYCRAARRSPTEQ